jgi:hypothetical protein
MRRRRRRHRRRHRRRRRRRRARRAAARRGRPAVAARALSRPIRSDPPEQPHATMPCASVWLSWASKAVDDAAPADRRRITRAEMAAVIAEMQAQAAAVAMSRQAEFAGQLAEAADQAEERLQMVSHSLREKSKADILQALRSREGDWQFSASGLEQEVLHEAELDVLRLQLNELHAQAAQRAREVQSMATRLAAREDECQGLRVQLLNARRRQIPMSSAVAPRHDTLQLAGAQQQLANLTHRVQALEFADAMR